MGMECSIRTDLAVETQRESRKKRILISEG